MSISLLIAPVAPEPQKMTASSLAAADRVADDLRARPRGSASSAGPVPRGLGVRVGVERQHLVADEVLDERQRAPRRGVVGVGDAARAVRRRRAPRRRR